MLLSTSSGSVEAAPPAVDGLTVVAAVVLLLRAGLAPGPARRRRRPQPEEAVVGRGRGEEGVLLGDHARLLVVGRVGLAQHQAARGWGESSGRSVHRLVPNFPIPLVCQWNYSNFKFDFNRSVYSIF